MRRQLAEAKELVQSGTKHHRNGNEVEVALDIDDAYRKVRSDGFAEANKIDSCFAEVINAERVIGYRHDRQMRQLAASAFYQAAVEDFRHNRLQADGRPNRESMYRFHSRLIRLGAYLERRNKEGKRVLENGRQAGFPSVRADDKRADASPDARGGDTSSQRIGWAPSSSNDGHAQTVAQ